MAGGALAAKGRGRVLVTDTQAAGPVGALRRGTWEAGPTGSEEARDWRLSEWTGRRAIGPQGRGHSLVSGVWVNGGRGQPHLQCGPAWTPPSSWWNHMWALRVFPGGPAPLPGLLWGSSQGWGHREEHPGSLAPREDRVSDPRAAPCDLFIVGTSWLHCTVF